MERVRWTATDPATRATFVAFVMLLGLENGCRGRGCGGPEPPGVGGRAPDGSSDTFALGGTDCSDGLVRCTAGRVEASRLAHLPYPCGGPPEARNACVCPWDLVTVCASGCALDGAVALADPDAGARQLCRPERPVARPAIGSDATARVCPDEGIVCRDGIVRICDQAGRVERIAAVCLHGCEPGISIDHGEAAIADGVAAILCRRPDAERR